MEKNADRKLMYLGDSSCSGGGGDADTRGHTPHNEIYGGERDVHLSHKRSLSFFQLSRDEVNT